jgi:hypothetical protein
LRSKNLKTGAAKEYVPLSFRLEIGLSWFGNTARRLRHIFLQLAVFKREVMKVNCRRDNSSELMCENTILVLKLLKPGKGNSSSYAILTVLFFKTRKTKRAKTTVLTNASARLNFALASRCQI